MIDLSVSKLLDSSIHLSQSAYVFNYAITEFKWIIQN